MSFMAGQRWTYRAPPEIGDSRIVIGALLAFESDIHIACCSVTGAWQRRPDGTLERVNIPFLPMTVEALSKTVVELDGTDELPEDFARHFEDWDSDARGLSYFTVPFEGSLDRMIALQMAAIVDPDDGGAATRS